MLGENDTLAKFMTMLGPLAQGIQQARFIDFTHRSDNVRYTIILIWTASDEDLRQKIYELGETLVRQTGWYPLPQGERVGSVRERSAVLRSGRWRTHIDSPTLGQIRTVEDAASRNGGTALRLGTDYGGLLLDVGFSGGTIYRPDDRIVLLSHAHRDHSGGLESRDTAHRPVIMSSDTAYVLSTRGVVDRGWLQERAVLVDPGHVFRLGPALAARPFRVPHFPGSVGYEIRDRNFALWYTGDIALTSSRHDSLTALLEQVAGSPAKKRAVILDATMAGRPHGSDSSPVAELLLADAADASDVVVTAQYADHLLYAHLDLFSVIQGDTSLRHQYRFVASQALRPLVIAIHGAFIERRLDQLDPYIAAQYGATMSAWAESRWLFWLGREYSHPRGKRTIWFVPYSELNRVDASDKVVVAAVGRLTERELSLPWSLPKRVSEVNTRGWTLHSNEEALRNAITGLSKHASVFLFHNYQSRLKRFCHQHNLNAKSLMRSPQTL